MWLVDYFADDLSTNLHGKFIFGSEIFHNTTMFTRSPSLIPIQSRRNRQEIKEQTSQSINQSTLYFPLTKFLYSIIDTIGISTTPVPEG